MERGRKRAGVVIPAGSRLFDTQIFFRRIGKAELR